MLETLTLWLGEHLPYLTLAGVKINLLAQVAGFIGLAIILYSYFQEKLLFLVISGFSYLFFIAEGFFLLPDSETLTNVIGNVIALFRNGLLVFWLAKKKKDLPAWAALPFVVVFWLTSIPSFGAWYTYIPPITVSLYSIAATCKNYYVVKGAALLHESAFLLYHPVTGAYIGGVRQAVLVLILIISIVRMYKRDHTNPIKQS